MVKLNKVLGKFYFNLHMCMYWVQHISFFEYGQRFKKTTLRSSETLRDTQTAPSQSVSRTPGRLESLIPKITASINLEKRKVSSQENNRPRLLAAQGHCCRTLYSNKEIIKTEYHIPSSR